MSKHEKNTKLFTKEILREAVTDSFKKLNPKFMIQNPVMFVVEIGFVLTFILTLFPDIFPAEGNNPALYNGIVSVILFITLLFANFAESIAEGRGKAQAEILKQTKKDMKAKLVQSDGTIKDIDSTQIKKGDIVLAEAGDIIPTDG